MRGFKGKVAIVTGAARGIGLATAEKLAEEGTDIILTDSSNDVFVSLDKMRENFPKNKDWRSLTAS